MNTDNFYDKTWTNNRSINYYQDFNWNNIDYHIQAATLSDWLKSIRLSYSLDTVLELGVGFGRITKIVYDILLPKFYLGIDISSHQIKNAREYLGPISQRVAMINADIIDLQIEKDNPGYDLVIASEILMHIKPEHIKQVIKLMVDCSNHDIINIDWNFGKIESDFCFIHDYDKLYHKAGAHFVNRIDLKSINQSIFHYRVEKS